MSASEFLVSSALLVGGVALALSYLPSAINQFESALTESARMCAVHVVEGVS